MKTKKWFEYRKQTWGETITIVILSIILSPFVGGGVIGAIVASIIITVIWNWWNSDKP